MDEVKKQFPFAGGMIRSMFRQPQETRYMDYEAPGVSIEQIDIKDNELTAKLATVPKTTQVEVRVDGKLIETITNEFDQIKCMIPGDLSGDSHEIAFHAFDRFFNRGFITAEI